MLTERIIRDARPRASPHIIWDARVKGLGLKVSPKGSRTYVIDYRTGGRQRRATIGRPSEISLADARRRAADELDAIRNGGADPLERKRASREAPTVKDALDRYFDEHVLLRVAHGRMTSKTVANYRSWAKHVYEGLGRHKVADVDRRHVERMVAGLPHTTRNRALSFTRSLFNVFEQWELRPRHSNPVYAIERSVEHPRDRVLTSDELASLAEALTEAEGRYPAAVAAIRLAAVTGLRIGEVLGIEWRDVDLETGRLVITTSKTGRRVHHLPVPALDLLRRLPRINAWCFTSGRDAGLTYRHALVVFKQVATAAGLSDIRLHDLRRGVMTRAAAAGASAHIIKDLLETPSFYPYLSGRDNLAYYQGISGRGDRKELNDLLKKVGLADRAHSRFRTYSLGMKQRLGLAYALLGDPELLFLDEPTNGMDPAGMAEIREMIRGLGTGERTVLLSSHLLHEVEQVCDSVAILSKGKLIAQGKVADLVHSRAGERVRLRTTDNAKAVEVLSALEWVGEVKIEGESVIVEAPGERSSELSAALGRSEVYVTEMAADEMSLEQYFLEITGDEKKDAE